MICLLRLHINTTCPQMISTIWLQQSCRVSQRRSHCRLPIARMPQAQAYCCCCCWSRINVNVTLFLHITLISEVQSTSDIDCFHAPDLTCSHVKSHNDPISDCQVDSAVMYSFIYMDFSSIDSFKDRTNIYAQQCSLLFV